MKTKKIMATTLLLTLALMLEIAFASAAWPSTNWITPRTDPSVRAGGPFPSASFAIVGLRAPIVTHSFCGIGCRQNIASAYYPRASIVWGPSFSVTQDHSNVRVGAAFPFGQRTPQDTRGTFVFSGGSRSGSSAFYG